MVRFKINFNFIADDFSIAGLQPKVFIDVLIHALLLFIAVLSHQIAYAGTSEILAEQNPFFTDAAGKADETKFLPRGNLFKPLRADPKELQFYLSYRPYQYGREYLSNSTEIFSGSLGDTFGLYRYTDNSGGYSWRANMSGGIYAEFDIKTSS